MTIVCGDSHTSTHGAFGALAHGIGTSEVEHVLATQTLIQKKAKNMRITVDGTPPPGVTAKDIILAIIGEIGTAGGTGHVMEYAGEAIRGLSMEGRMTVCNMSIEGGARAGLIAPDETTFAYIKGRPKAPKGDAWDMAMRHWETLRSDDGAAFRPRGEARRRQAAAARHLGDEPGERHHHRRQGARPGRRSPIPTAPRGRAVARLYGPRARHARSRTSRSSASSSAPAPMAGSRISAPRRRSSPARRVHDGVTAMVVPGSGLVKEQAEAEGLDKIFLAAGFEWREPGCSMCLAMNDDRLTPGRALRLDLEPQFRGPPGLQGPHPPRLAGHGRRGGDRRPLRRRAGVGVGA